MARPARRLLTWLYVKFLRNYVLVDVLLARSQTGQTNTLYVVHLDGGRVATPKTTTEQPARWN